MHERTLRLCALIIPSLFYVQDMDRILCAVIFFNDYRKLVIMNSVKMLKYFLRGLTFERGSLQDIWWPLTCFVGLLISLERLDLKIKLPGSW